MRKFIISLLVLLPGIVLAQTTTDNTTKDIPAKKDTLISFDGSLKAKFEVSTSQGDMRFSVRNSRVGVKGNYHDFLGYRLQVELNNEGQFSVLDIYGSIRYENLTMILGQTLIPFENSYVVTPSEMMFANRAFIGKYFTPGSRDLGVVAQYKFKLGQLPFEAQGGIFNGGKMNAPTWTDSPSLAAKLTAGNINALKASAKVYRYDADTSTQLFYWGADFSYRKNNLLIQGEVMDRYNLNSKNYCTGFYLQGAYAIPATFWQFKYIQPALRWDAMGYDFLNSGLDVNRATIGLNFGLCHKYFSTLLRLNFEQYFIRNGLAANFPEVDKIGGFHALDNKLTLELLIIF